jgi:hypothetical protein
MKLSHKTELSIRLNEWRIGRKMAPVTIRLIAEHEALGFEIVIGNDYRLPTRPKWRNYEVRRLCGTNSRRHGRCIRTVFAVKLREVAS